MIWLCVLSLLFLAGPAFAQGGGAPPALMKSSTDSGVIRAQLQLASERGRTALTMLETLEDGQPIDNAVSVARETYVLIRVARAGLLAKQGMQKFKDPLMDTAVERLTRAWNLSRTPVDRSKDGITRVQYLTESVRDLSGALQILDEVVWLIP